MDCNSIVYDCFAKIQEAYKKNDSKTKTKTKDTNSIESELIRNVISAIEHYIDVITPTKSVYIAFDGVAPFAKMDQQRLRRYKSQFMTRMDFYETPIWDTTAITPGTAFMQKLDQSVYQHFSTSKTTHKRPYTIRVSCSDECGEGEHKLFSHVRANQSLYENSNIAVYGLDSDLIMLAIFHRQYCDSMYIFRETPAFKYMMQSQQSAEKYMFLDILELSRCIFSEMRVQNTAACVNDYIFLCFILGNDFLPHFPAFNIRTHGTQILMDSYRTTIGRHANLAFIQQGRVQWKNVHKFIQALAKQESGHFLAEHIARNKFEKKHWPTNTKEEKEEFFNNYPIIFRQKEKYICPEEKGWQKRYYRALFNIDPTEENIKRICMNYLEGLEWVFAYYTRDCPDWRWKYHWNYGPLMQDLQMYVLEYKPQFHHSTPPTPNPYTKAQQLTYVLPREKLWLLGDIDPANNPLLENYPETYEMESAYCRYGWEMKPILPTIQIV
jgi:5'-3' exonuclease